MRNKIEKLELFEDFGNIKDISVDDEVKVNESGSINTANRIENELKTFLKDVVIPKSKGYVKDERDAAILLIEILSHKYNI